MRDGGKRGIAASEEESYMIQAELFETPAKPVYAVMQSWYGWPMVAYQSSSLAKVRAEEKRRRALGYPVIDIAMFTG